MEVPLPVGLQGQSQSLEAAAAHMLGSAGGTQVARRAASRSHRPPPESPFHLLPLQAAGCSLCLWLP